MFQTALIVLTGWFVFLPALHGDWLWDDALEITENPELSDPSGLWKIWFEPMGSDYFPLKSTVQWVQWRLWQDHLPGYHLTNVVLHLISALLLWHLLRKLGLRLAWLGGLLFVVHPVVVESVAWIAELKNTLSLPLLLLAMCAWLDYDTRGRRADYVRSLLLFLAAMLSKSSVVMFPVILLLHAWWKRGRVTRADLKASAAFFGISLGLGLVTVWFQDHRAIGWMVIPRSGFFSRLAGAGMGLGFYFFKSVFPSGLLPIYPRWNVHPHSPIQFLPWPLLGAALYGLWTQRATWGRHVLLGVGFFLINLAPVLGFISMSWLRITWVADHFAYLPLVGLIGLAAAGAGMADARLAVPMRPYALATAIMICGFLAWQSRRYCGIFRNQETLWTYTLQRNPEAWLAHGNLGTILLEHGKLPEAISHFEQAVRLKPDYAEAHYNLGNALLMRNRLPEAMGHYREALRIKPDYAKAHNNLGIALMQAGRLPEAVAQFEQGVQLEPDSADAHVNLGNALFQAGRLPEAIEHYGQALRIDPDDTETRHHLEFARRRVSWQEARPDH